MHLQELKAKSPADLLAYAEEVEIENASALRKQDMMFAILKQLAENGTPIYGSGVLEVCLMVLDSYVHQNQIICPVPTIYMCHQAKLDGLVYAQEIQLKGKFGPQKMASDILPY